MPLTLSNLSCTYPNGTRALSPLNLNIPDHQFLAILGPSGCGKSTLLRLISHLDPPTTGNVVFPSSNKQLATSNPPLSYVFQDAHLLPWRTALSNVELPLELSHVPDRTARAREALSLVGLTEFAGHYPSQLSGGMRMRVSLARALVTNPSLLLMDEPFAALDEITRQSLDETLYTLWQSRPMTILFVTHSIPEATYLAQRALVLSPRPARVLLDHPIDLPASRPASLRGDPAFAAQTRILYESLHAGMRT